MEELITGIFENASKKAVDLHESNFTYVDEQGLRRCKICGKRLETIIHTPHIPKLDGMKVNCVCDCDRARLEKIKAEMKALEKDAEKGHRRATCFKSPEMYNWVFTNDDSPESWASRMSRRWVANYEKNVESDNSVKWLFYHGGFGTGKSYYAACIANAMIDKGYDVRMGNGADFEAELAAAEDKAVAYKRLAAYDLLILDDFAAERKTDYMYELLFTIVNDRFTAHKPMIFTSNMSVAETGNPTDPRLRRIMSRIYGAAFPIEMNGADRRKAKGAFK